MWLLRGRVVIVALALALPAAFGVVQAQAQTGEADPGAPLISADQLDQLWNALAAGPVFVQKCQNELCHADLLTEDTDRDKASEIIFSHGIHRGQFDCSACHDRFPHKFGEIDKPEMQECFACHGLRHGPVGIIAYDTCDSCHRTARDRLRPAFHTADWAREPHVQPSLKELQTRCMMCHDGPFCDDCHRAEYVRWEPEQPYLFDAGTVGCKQCHAQVSMVRFGPGGTSSYRVDGLDASVHRNLTCIQCHVDFRWDDVRASTPVWNVNAGLACRDCHDHADQSKAYEASVHWQRIQSRDFDSATCGSCHGGHDIQPLDTEAARKALTSAQVEMCARCHREEYDQYNDYYHGAAFKRGTPDAPACWDCHEAHEVLPSKDPSSSVSAARLAATCASEGCHRDTSDKFVEAAKSLIHRKESTAGDNPVWRFFGGLFGWLDNGEGA